MGALPSSMFVLFSPFLCDLNLINAIKQRGVTPRKRRKLNLPLDERNPARLTFASNNEIYYTADSKCNRASFTQQGGEPFSTLKVEEEILAEADIGKAIVRVTPSNLTYTPSGERIGVERKSCDS